MLRSKYLSLLLSQQEPTSGSFYEYHALDLLQVFLLKSGYGSVSSADDKNYVF